MLASYNFFPTFRTLHNQPLTKFNSMWIDNCLMHFKELDISQNYLSKWEYLHPLPYVGFMGFHLYQTFLNKIIPFLGGKCKGQKPWFEFQTSKWKFETKYVFIQLILFPRKIQSNMTNFHTVDSKELSLKKSSTHLESFHSLFCQ